MTVANNYGLVRYVANGSTTAFAVDWRLESADDFVVYKSVDGVQTVVDQSEYTAVNTDTEHKVVFNTAPASGTVIAITRSTPQEQDTPYKTSSGFQAIKVEEDFDSLTMMIQELQQDVDRAVKVNETETITPEELRNEIFEVKDEAEASAALAQEWATKTDGTVDGSEYSAKYYANASKDSATASAGSATAASGSADLAQAWATKTDGQVGGVDYSSKYYASQSATSASAAANSADLAEDWATKMDGTVDGVEYSAKYYADLAGQEAGTLTGANKDLSNLTPTGNDKFVTKDTAQTITGVKTFSVSPLVPTATSGDSSTNAASTAFVTTADNALQTQINAKADDNAVVHLAGAETITGAKTFSGTGWITYIKNTEVTYNTAPSSDKNSSLVFVDKNNTQMGTVECFRPIDNSTIMQFNVYGANGAWLSLPLQLRVEADGTAAAYAPASAATNSVVTTKAISKSANGYVKLGNGLIIQWGTVALNGQNWVTVTLPTAFTSTNYQVALSSAEVGWQSGVMHQTRNKTTTTFETLGQGSPLSWIAIGY